MQQAHVVASARQPPRKFAPCGTRTRFMLLPIMLLCLSSVWSNIMTFNFAVICMTPTSSNHESNSTSPYMTTTTPAPTRSKDGVHIYTTNERMWAMFAVAITGLIGNFITIQLINRFQIRVIFTVLGYVSALATLLLPTGMKSGIASVIVLRVLQGVGFSANFPVVGEFSNKWTYFKQSGFAVSTLVSYVQLAPAITNPLSGALCTRISWQSIFYFHGAFSIVIFSFFFILYRNSPAKHPLVGQREQIKIATGKPSSAQRKQQYANTPYLAILKTPAVWAVWVSSFGNFACVNLIFLYSPTFMSQALGYSVSNTGLSSALPPLIEFFVKIGAGAISDRIKFISEITKYRFFNTVSYFVCAGFLILTGYVSKDTSEVVVTVIITCGIGFLGVNTGGFYKNGPVISKQYSHFVTGYVSLGLNITMVIIPFFVTSVAPHNTIDEWRVIFFSIAGVLVVTNIFFCIFVSAQPCEWTKDSWNQNHGVVQPVENGNIAASKSSPLSMVSGQTNEN